MIARVYGRSLESSYGRSFRAGAYSKPRRSKQRRLHRR